MCERHGAPQPAAGAPWRALLLGAVLLTTGCATRVPHAGEGARPGARALLRSPLVPRPFASPGAGEPERSHWRPGARGLGSDTRVGAGEAAVHGVA
ncbi:hypothetical protein, partial [Archangium violaceum]|uniref:hypothetical protein n=1 Tax=Archangium violaceum TaxID=83451 RepID=UPI001F4617CA